MPFKPALCAIGIRLSDIEQDARAALRPQVSQVDRPRRP